MQKQDSMCNYCSLGSTYGPKFHPLPSSLDLFSSVDVIDKIARKRSMSLNLPNFDAFGCNGMVNCYKIFPFHVVQLQPCGKINILWGG